MSFITIARNLWLEIRNEKVRNANTAERVGDAGAAILDAVESKADYSGQNVYENVGGVESTTKADVELSKRAGYSSYAGYSNSAGSDEDGNNIKETYFKKGTFLFDDITGVDTIGYPGSFGITLVAPWNEQYNFNLEIRYSSFEEAEQGQSLIAEITFENGIKYRNTQHDGAWGNWMLFDGGAGKSAYQLALDNGFVGTEAEWLVSLNGSPGFTPVKGIDYNDGANGLTPTIGGNGNWWIGITDTGISAQDLTTDQKKILNTIPLICSDETTDITASTTVRKNRYVFQTAQSFTNIIGELIVPAVGGYFTIIVKKNGVNVFSTNMTFNSGSGTTRTATIPSVLVSSPLSFAIGDYVEVFVTGVGSVTSGQGLTVYLI